MSKYHVTLYPYATQEAEIDIPDEFQTNAEIEEYIREHIDDIVDKDDVSLDYCGTDMLFDFEEA